MRAVELTESQARQLLSDEAFGPDGLLVKVRMGDDPGPERFDRVLAAVRTVFDAIGNAQTIDRPLAHALFALANDVEGQVGGWMDRGMIWRSRLVDQELPNLLMAVESVFAGEWLGEDGEGEAEL